MTISSLATFSQVTLADGSAVLCLLGDRQTDRERETERGREVGYK